jgi:outer membrane protein assembly factor BamA
MHFFYRVALLAAFSLIIGTAFLFPATVRAQQPQPQQRVVEEVDIQGNRRLRKDDVLYYVQTRAGDTFSEAQVARDWKKHYGVDAVSILERFRAFERTKVA